MTLVGFDNAWPRVAEHTKMTAEQMHNIFGVAKRTVHLGGAVADVGCWRGAIARTIAMADRGVRQVHLFDTFAGVPDRLVVRQLDTRKAGDHPGCQPAFIEQQAHFDGLEYEFAPNLVIHRGVFPSCVDPGDQEFDALRYSLVIIDLELWMSTYHALVYFYPRMIPGGIILMLNMCAPEVHGTLAAYNHFIQRYKLQNIAIMNRNAIFQGEIVVNEPNAGVPPDQEGEVAPIEFVDEPEIVADTSKDLAEKMNEAIFATLSEPTVGTDAELLRTDMTSTKVVPAKPKPVARKRGPAKANKSNAAPKLSTTAQTARASRSASRGDRPSA